MAISDLNLFQTNPTTNKVEQELVTTYNTGYLVTGPTKLMQRFLLELFTVKGSLTYKSARGSQFVVFLRRGAASTLDVVSAFTLAMLDVQPNLTSEESDTDPLDEKFAAAELKEIQIGNGNVGLKFAIQNQAGTVLNVTVPLSFSLL